MQFGMNKKRDTLIVNYEYVFQIKVSTTIATTTTYLIQNKCFLKKETFQFDVFWRQNFIRTSFNNKIHFSCNKLWIQGLGLLVNSLINQMPQKNYKKKETFIYCISYELLS